MKVVLVGLGFRPIRYSGLDTYTERLADGLAERGHDVSVVTAVGNRGGVRRTVGQVQIYQLPLGPSNWIGYSIRVARFLEALAEQQPGQIVHFADIHFGAAYGGPFFGTLHQSFRQRLAINQSFHPRSLYYGLARFLAEKPALKRARGLMSVSRTTSNEFATYYGIPEDRIYLTPNAIDTIWFSPRVSREKLRRTLKIDPDEPVLFFAGYVSRRKGLDVLARAIGTMSSPPRLVVAGKWSPKSRTSFREQLGIHADRLIDVGYLADEVMPDYYSMADLYVSPSLLEGFGIPLAEALACETPVISANGGAAAEVVGPGGVLVAPGDSRALAEAIQDVLARPSLRIQMGKMGREHVRTHYNLQNLVDNTLRCYTDNAF